MRNLRDEARWIIGEIDEAKRLAKAVGKPQLGTSSIEAGRVEEYDQDGALVQIIGEQYDGTHAPVTVNGPTPPEPSGLSLTVGVGSVEARWNGKFAGDAVSPMDFSHVSLHGSRPEVFTPSNETQLATIAGELGDVATVILEPGEWTFGLVAVSKAGKWSELSETVTVEIPDYPAPVDIQDDLILLDEKYEGVITEAGSLGGRLDQAEQELTAHEGRLEQAETDVNTALSGDVDIDRLAIGNGVIRDLVAQHIAGKTAAFQQVDVKNLFVTTGTMTEAVINKLFTDVVMSRKITAEMLAIGSFDNLFSEPDFKEGGSSWGIWGSNTVGMFGREGTSALRLIGTGGNVAVYNQPLRRPVAPSSSYRGVAWVRASANVPASSFRLIGVVYSASGEISYSWVSAPALVEGEWTFISGAMDISSEAATASFGVTVRSNFPSGVTLDVDFVSLTRMSAGELVVDGSIKARHADLEDFAANTGFIADLTARIVKSEMFVGKEFQGGTFTGSVFQTSGIASVGLKLDSAGMRVYGAEGGEPVTEIRADGGTVYSITDPVTGDTLASLDRDGNVSGQELNITGDPVFLGSPLLGDTVNFQHPSEFETPGLLDVLPRGMIARGYRNISDRTSVTNQEMEILEFSYVHEPGRAYRITVAPFAAYVAGSNGYGYLNVYITTDGSRPVMSATPTFRQYVRNRNTSEELSTFGGVFYNVGYQPTARVVRIMVTIASEGGTMNFHPNSLASSVRTWVEDMGLSAPDTGVDRNGRMDLAVPTPVPPPEPPPPSKENYTQVWKSTGYRSFDGNGRYSYADGTNKIYQGTMGRTGMLRSMVTFGNGSKGQSIVQALSGAKINSVKVTMRFDHWWSNAGGTAQIMLHGESGLTSSPPSMTLAATSSKWPKPGTRTVSIPSSRWDGLKSGQWKGIGLGNGSSGLTYYGYARASSVSLEIKYTK